MKGGQRTKLDELVLHKARLAQRQLVHQGTRLFERGHIQQENRASLRLANPPLVDLASQVQSKRSWHFLWKDLPYLLRCWRLRELPDSQNFRCRDYWENALSHFLGVGLVLNVIHIQLLSGPVNPFLFPSIREYREHNSQASRHPLHNS